MPQNLPKTKPSEQRTEHEPRTEFRACGSSAKTHPATARHAFFSTVDESAKIVFKFLSDYACGARLDDLAALVKIADRLGCTVSANAGTTSSYCSNEGCDYPAEILLGYGGCTDEADLVRLLVHELAHHILNRYGMIVLSWVPELRPHFADPVTEEYICRMVADFVIALPDGLLWNGKLALPTGDGYIRVFKQLGVRIPSQEMSIEQIRELEGV